MKLIAFNRFVIHLKISSKELWWTEESHGNRHWYLLDLSIVERSVDDFTYKGFQIILLNFQLCCGDAGSVKRSKCK